jgi:di/tricarboxylate transporter
VNPGLLAIVLAGIVGLYLAPLSGQAIPVRDIVAGFPVDLFLTLAGVTLFFTQANENGTLEQVARAGVRCCRGNAGLVPIMFFFLAFAFASIGAGNIAASALISPLAMAAAQRARIPAFLMTIMVAHGAIAGALSPLSPTGVIAAGLLNNMKLGGFEWHLYLQNLWANVAVALGGYFLFGGGRLFRNQATARATENATDVPAASTPTAAAPTEPQAAPETAAPFLLRHTLTLAVIALLIVGVVWFKVHLGLGAFAAAVLLSVLGLSDDNQAIRKMPWGVILMVTGVTVLTSLLEKTGGADRFVEIVAYVATPQTLPAVIGFLVAVISVYSSTSGVVLPAFLPMVPRLVSEVGGSPLGIASSIIIAGHLVDSSPLSTIGALCIASAPPTEDRQRLFNQVLLWGLAMSVVGALGCYIAFGLF